MTNDDLRKRVRFLELLVAGYRRRFKAFLQPKKCRDVSRSEVLALVAYWRGTLDNQRIWYDESRYFENAVADAYDMLPTMGLLDWKACIDWYWLMKPADEYWRKIRSDRLKTVARAQPEWRAQQDKPPGGINLSEYR